MFPSAMALEDLSDTVQEKPVLGSTEWQGRDLPGHGGLWELMAHAPRGSCPASRLSVSPCEPGGRVR